MNVLLGADVFYLIFPRVAVEGPPGTPSAVRTQLGWTVSCRAPQSTLGDAPQVQVSSTDVKLSDARLRLPVVNGELPPYGRQQACADHRRRRWDTGMPAAPEHG